MYPHNQHRVFKLSSSLSSILQHIIIVIVSFDHQHLMFELSSSPSVVQFFIITAVGCASHRRRLISSSSSARSRAIVGQTRGRVGRGPECARERDGGHDTVPEGGQDGQREGASGRASGREGGRRTSGRAEGSKGKSRALRAGGPARCRVALSMPSPSSLVIDTSSQGHRGPHGANERAERRGPCRRSRNPRPVR